MTVLFKGPLMALGGHAGLSLEYARNLTIGDAVVFDQVFLDVPAIFVCGESDKFVYAGSSSKTGFTPEEASATNSGAGTKCNYLAIGRGDGSPAYRMFSNIMGDLDYGSCAVDGLVSYPGSYGSIPTVLCTPKSDVGIFAGGTPAASGFTPEDLTGDGGAGSAGNYLALGTGSHKKLVKHVSAVGDQVAALWVEIGTFAALSAVTFAYPFKSTPTILCSMTSDGQCYAASSAVTGFTPTTITLVGKGAGTAGVYMAIGPKLL